MASENLPMLTGSEKQVAWAEQIRAQLIEQVEEVFSRAKDAAGVEMARAALAAACAEHTDAAWWIDNQDRGRHVFDPYFAAGLKAKQAREIVASHPTWSLTPFPFAAGSFDLWRRGDDSAVVGTADEWRFVGSYPSRADALGEIEETLAFEARATRREERKAR